MIKFKYYKNYSKYSTDVNNSNIQQDDIVFLEDQKIIRTHDTEFKCTGDQAMAKINVNLEAYVNDVKTSGTDLNGLTITLYDTTDSETVETKTWQGETVTFSDVVPLKNYSVSVQSKSGYTQPTAQTITNISIAQTVTKTFAYEADQYNIVVTGSADGRVVIDNTEYANGSTVQVAKGATVTATAKSVTNYTSSVSTLNKTITATYSTSNVVLTMGCTIDNSSASLPTGAKAYVSIDGGASTEYTGASNTIQVAPGSNVTITFATVGGYDTPQTVTLNDISTGNNTASGVWAANTYVVNINTNQPTHTAISSASVNLSFNQSTNHLFTGYTSNSPILIPASITPSTSNISADSVTNYKTSITIDGTNITVQYQTEKVVVTLTNDSTSNDTGGVVYPANQTVTINGTSVTATETSTNVWQAIAYVAFDTQYSIVYGAAGSWKGSNDYATPASVTNRTANQATYSVTGQYLMQRGTLYSFVVTDNQNGASGAASNCTITINYTDSNSVSHSPTISYPATSTYLIPNGSTITSVTGSSVAHFTPYTTNSGTTYTITYKAAKITVTSNISTGTLYIYEGSNVVTSDAASSITGYVAWGSSYAVSADIVTSGTYYYASDITNSSGTANTATINSSVTYTQFTLATGDWADLGLPSGTLWATKNYGASTMYNGGTYYTWNSAMALSFSEGQIPSKTMCEELRSNCTFIHGTVNGNDVYIAISNQNNVAIINPLGYTWSSTEYSSNSYVAWRLGWYNGRVSHGRKDTSDYQVRLVKKSYPEDIKAVTSDGTLTDKPNADCVGVYVGDGNRGFIIGKNNISSNTAYWDNSYSTNGVVSGVYATDSSTTAKTDYNGYANTQALVALSSGGEAAKACYNDTITIGGETRHGYLGACGEWDLAYGGGTNKAAIDSLMSQIGGTALTANWYWTSTQGSSNSPKAWVLSWDDGYVYYDYKDGHSYVRAFYQY